MTQKPETPALDVYRNLMGEEGVWCDLPDCKALNDPQTEDELREALEHWRDHPSLSGCSHGN